MARQRGNRWQADVRRDDGSRLRPTFETKAKAEAWESAARLAISEGKPVPPTSTGSVGNRSLATLGSLFEHVKRTHWSDLKSADTLIRNGKQVVDMLGSNMAVKDITSATIASLRADFADNGLSGSTVNRKCAALSKMLHIAKDAGVIASVPKTAWKKEEQTKFRYLDDREEDLLLAYWQEIGDPDQGDLCTVLLDTGARCFSELIPAPWDAFGPDFKSVTFWHTKTGKPRTVPLTKRSQEIVKARHRLKGNHAGPFTMVNKDTMRTRWDRMRTLLEFDDVTPHTLRHTCCTRLVMANVDVKRIMTWMGHSTIVTTMRYMQIKPTALEDIVHHLERRAAA